MYDPYGPGSPPWDFVDNIRYNIRRLADNNAKEYSIEGVAEFIRDALTNPKDWPDDNVDDDDESN